MRCVLLDNRQQELFDVVAHLFSVASGLDSQVIGETEVNEADTEVRHLGFYRRYERWILPLVVMTIGLVIVSFGPLAIHDFPQLAFVKDWFPMQAQ